MHVGRIRCGSSRGDARLIFDTLKWYRAAQKGFGGSRRGPWHDILRIRRAEVRAGLDQVASIASTSLSLRASSPCGPPHRRRQPRPLLVAAHHAPPPRPLRAAAVLLAPRRARSLPSPPASAASCGPLATPAKAPPTLRRVAPSPDTPSRSAGGSPERSPSPVPPVPVSSSC